MERGQIALFFIQRIFSFVQGVAVLKTLHIFDHHLKPIKMTQLLPPTHPILDQLKDFDLITFGATCISWSQGLWTISRVSEKAILIDDEWLPKSQILSVSMVKRRNYDADGNFEIVIVPELIISSWFDKMNNGKRKKGWAF